MSGITFAIFWFSQEIQIAQQEEFFNEYQDDAMEMSDGEDGEPGTPAEPPTKKTKSEIGELNIWISFAGKEWWGLSIDWRSKLNLNCHRINEFNFQ